MKLRQARLRVPPPASSILLVGGNAASRTPREGMGASLNTKWRITPASWVHLSGFNLEVEREKKCRAQGGGGGTWRSRQPYSSDPHVALKQWIFSPLRQNVEKKRSKLPLQAATWRAWRRVSSRSLLMRLPPPTAPQPCGHAMNFITRLFPLTWRRRWFPQVSWGISQSPEIHHVPGPFTQIKIIPSTPLRN